MFGKRKPKEEVPVNVEPDLVVDKETELTDEEFVQVTKPVPVSKPVPIVEPKKEVKPQAQIVSGEILENGIHRYVILSNKAIGEIGEVTDL